MKWRLRVGCPVEPWTNPVGEAGLARAAVAVKDTLDIAILLSTPLAWRRFDRTRFPAAACRRETGEAMTDRITLERDGHVLLMGVNRPEKRNAFDLATIAQLGAAYERLGTDADLRAGVLFAHGEHFSAGLDLAEVGPAVAERGPQALAGDSAYDPFGVWKEPVGKPVVMAVNGIAFTLSIELALGSDIVVAATDVRFRQLEIGRGIIPFGGATIRAQAQLGWGNAMRFLLTAEEFGADEALRIGLVQEVVAPGEHVARAIAIAQRIAAQAPLGVQATLANARVAATQGHRAAIDHLAGVLPGILASEDAAEGLRSFVERREARFSGR
jgi:enoyl-CoA hydratase